MDVLRELVQVIDRIKLRAIRNLGFPFTKGNQLDAFYDFLVDGTGEKDIALSLTGKASKNSTYRRLKLELEDRLIAGLFLVDLSRPSFTDRKRAYYEVYKHWTAAKILLGENAHRAALQLAQRCLRQTREFEFNQLRFIICRDLRLLYGTSVPDARKYEAVAEECKEAETFLWVENQAEALYADLIATKVRKGAEAEAISGAASAAYRQLQPHLQNIASYTLHLYAGLIRMIIYTAVKDYESTVGVCDDIITHFEQKPYVASVPLQAAYYQKLVCYFQLRRFDEQIPALEASRALFTEGAYNWFKFQETFFLLALHTRQYDKAYHVYQQVSQQPRLTQLSAEVREYWRVLEAYLHLLVELKQVPAAIGDSYFTKFRIGRFINQTPNFSKDKRGLNVSILIVQILFLLVRQRYGDAIDKIDAVEQYCRRYLFRQDTLRSYYFIKALLELPKNDFHREAVRRKADKHLQRMRAYPLEQAGPVGVVTEIIPFEDVWQWVITQLPTRFFRKRS